MGDFNDLRERMAREIVYGKDYDMGSYLASGGKPRPAGQHYPDAYKTPSHPTFSDESMFSSPENQGGKWVVLPDNQLKYVSAEESGQWHFFASQDNVMNYGGKNLADYFSQVEPNSQLHLPFSAGLANLILGLSKNK